MSAPPILIASVAPALAVVFATGGMAHLVGPRPLTRQLERLGYPRGFQRVIGLYALLTALFFAVPLTHIWGVVLAGFFLFAGIVGLLNERRYKAAIPAMALLASLPFVLAAGMW